MTKEDLIRGLMVREGSGHSEETERILRDWPLSGHSTKCVDPFDEIRRNSLSPTVASSRGILVSN